MARKEIVVLTDDLTGKDTLDVRTVTFGFNGLTYEIDLNDKNFSELEDRLGKFISAARTTGKTGKVTTRARLRSGTTKNGNGKAKSDPIQNKAIREWAKKSGYDVKNAGSIKQDIVDAYHRAGGQVSTPPSPTPEPEEIAAGVAKAVAEAVAKSSKPGRPRTKVAKAVAKAAQPATVVKSRAAKAAK